ncbi:MAG: glucokinase, partial [Anaerolineales bacterium]|nr:glucokinase [Anaerolineales bacterium]
PISAAAFGVAGPIVNGVAKITNLSWTIDQIEVAHALDLAADKVQLLNDLEAMATAVPFLLPEDVQTLNTAEPVAQRPIAVVAPGTGLGEAFLTWNGRRYVAFPSEGGHADFAPGDSLQLRLLNYLAPQYGHVSVERVCSGIGIPNLYAFLRDEKIAEEPQWLREMMDQVDDIVPVIIQHAFDKAAAVPICVQTMEMFAHILAAEAGNMALKLLSRGGVYLGGGLPPRILPMLQAPRFMELFYGKGRFAQLMAQIPVYIILNQRTGLLGAGYAALALDESL